MSRNKLWCIDAHIAKVLSGVVSAIHALDTCCHLIKSYISEYQWNRFNPKVSGSTKAFWEDQLCRIYLYLYLYLYSIEYRVQQKPCSPRHTKYKTILPRQEDSLFWPFKLNSCPGCQLSPCKWLGAVALNIQQDGHRVHTRIVTCRPSCWYITRWTLDTDR